MVDPLKQPPTAIIDNLEHIGDRRHRETQGSSVARYFRGKPVAGSDVDYVTALRFLASYCNPPIFSWGNQ